MPTRIDLRRPRARHRWIGLAGAVALVSPLVACGSPDPAPLIQRFEAQAEEAGFGKAVTWTGGEDKTTHLRGEAAVEGREQLAEVSDLLSGQRQEAVESGVSEHHIDVYVTADIDGVVFGTGDVEQDLTARVGDFRDLRVAEVYFGSTPPALSLVARRCPLGDAECFGDVTRGIVEHEDVLTRDFSADGELDVRVPDRRAPDDARSGVRVELAPGRERPPGPTWLKESLADVERLIGLASPVALTGYSGNTSHGGHALNGLRVRLTAEGWTEQTREAVVRVGEGMDVRHPGPRTLEVALPDQSAARAHPGGCSDEPARTGVEEQLRELLERC